VRFQPAQQLTSCQMACRGDQQRGERTVTKAG
jgi:hypothetical protein